MRVRTGNIFQKHRRYNDKYVLLNKFSLSCNFLDRACESTCTRVFDIDVIK